MDGETGILLHAKIIKAIYLQMLPMAKRKEYSGAIISPSDNGMIGIRVHKCN